MDKDEIKELAKRIRLNVVRMSNRARSGHLGSALSIVDIIAVLYGKIMNYDVKDPKSKTRDRFILSKGHAGSAVYAALAEMGFISKELLDSHYEDGSLLSGHVSHIGIPGVEISTGSLGHGLGIGIGFALNAKLKKMKYKVFVVMSDGECDEGSNWESALFASHHKLNNLVAIIDYNKIQCIGRIHEVLSLEPLAKKWKSFNWNVFEIDGHSIEQLVNILENLPDNGKPNILIAHTIKGKGVSFMEDKIVWHYRWPRETELIKAEDEINKGS